MLSETKSAVVLSEIKSFVVLSRINSIVVLSGTNSVVLLSRINSVVGLSEINLEIASGSTAVVIGSSVVFGVGGSVQVIPLNVPVMVKISQASGVDGSGTLHSKIIRIPSSRTEESLIKCSKPIVRNELLNFRL